MEEYNIGTHVLSKFPDCSLPYDGERCSNDASRMRLRRRKKDYAEEIRTGISWDSKHKPKESAITRELDNMLYARVISRIGNRYVFRDVLIYLYSRER